MKIQADPINLKAKGYYSFAVYDTDGVEVKEKSIGRVDNVVTYNGGYKMFFVGGRDFFSFYDLVVGTGTTEIQRTDNALGNLLVQANFGRSIGTPNPIDNNDGTSTEIKTRTYAFDIGEVVGNISEIGLYDSSNTLIAGQLIKDELGNPTTVTILESEQLVASYTLEVTYLNANPSGTMPVLGTGSVTTNGGSSNYTLYAQPLLKEWADPESKEIKFLQQDAAYVFCDSSGQPLGAAGDDTPATITHDGSGTVTLDFTLQTASPAEFNSTDIAYILCGSENANTQFSEINTTTKIAPSSSFGATAALVLEFDTPLTKTSSDSISAHLELTVTV